MAEQRLARQGPPHVDGGDDAGRRGSRGEELGMVRHHLAAAEARGSTLVARTALAAAGTGHQAEGEGQGILPEEHVEVLVHGNREHRR